LIYNDIFDIIYYKTYHRAELYKKLKIVKERDMTLTKADLVQEVYKHHEGLTKAQAVESVEALLRISKDTLINGSDLLLSGFGKFNVRDKRSRKGRNPKTGEDLQLDARRVVTFKPSGMLRDKVNGS
jgi:integration host factor subunit alpha